MKVFLQRRQLLPTAASVSVSARSGSPGAGPLVVVAALTFCAASNASAKAQPTPAAHPMLAAKQAFERQDIGGLSRARSQLSGDPLVVWPSYWNARIVVGKQPFGSLAKESVSQFEREFSGHPLVQTLKSDWLLAAVRAKSWPELATLLKEIPAHPSEPASAQCARVRLASESAPTNNPADILIGRETHEGCLGLLEDLVEKRRIDPQTLLLRARWAGLAGDTKAAARISRAAQAAGLKPNKSEPTLLSVLALSKTNIARAVSEYARIQKTLNAEQQQHQQM